MVALNQIPVGFHADEVRVGWNAYSILHTLKDDFGNRFPLYYNTFGDYRPTGVIYASIPGIMLFGLNVFGTRFMSALVGALTPLILYWYLTEAEHTKKEALLAGGILAILPWHIAVSRATSEAVWAVAITLAAMAVLVRAMQKKENTRLIYMAAGVSLVSYLFYHSARVVTPIFFVLTVWQYRRHITEKTSTAIILSVLCLGLTTIGLTFNGKALGRLKQVAVKPQQQSHVLGAATSQESFWSLVRTEYMTYLSPEFYVGGEARPLRYRVSDYGLMTFPFLVLMVLGIAAILSKKASRFPLLFLFLAPLPAALTSEDSPNLIRSFYMTPFVAILVMYGIYSLSKKHKLLQILLVGAVIYTTAGYIYSSLWYNRLDPTPYRNYKTDELISIITKGQSEYEKIIVTNDPDSPFPWYAFYNKLDPAEFNQYAQKRTDGAWEYKNIIFTWDKCPAANAFDTYKSEHIMVVDMGDCSSDGTLHEHKDVRVLSQIEVNQKTTARILVR